MKLENRIQDKLSDTYMIDPITIALIIAVIKIVLPYIMDLLDRIFKDDKEFYIAFRSKITYLSLWDQLVLRYKFHRVAKNCNASVSSKDLLDALKFSIINSSDLELSNAIKEYI